MTQQSGATPASENPEQPQEAQSAQMTDQASTSAKPGKHARNLYEPYNTPTSIWVALRTVARFIYFL